MSKPREFTCEECGGTFTEEWTPEEAEAEFAATFPEEKREEAAIVCDPCYLELMALARAEGLIE